MPDGDYFPGLYRSWRRVGHAVRGNHPPEIVGALAEKALADQLRTDRVGPTRFGEAACAIAHGGADALRAVVSDADLRASPLLRHLDDVCQTAQGADELDLIARTLDRVVRDQFDTMRPQIVSVDRNVAEVTHYLDECVANVRVGPLAEQVAGGRPHIRAPRRSRVGTADLLDQALT